MLTTGFAALAVGTLNLISVAFAILFVGIAVDFAIQFCVRYRRDAADLRPAAEAAARGHRRAASGRRSWSPRPPPRPVCWPSCPPISAAWRSWA